MEKTAYSQRVRGNCLRPRTAVVAYLGLDGDVQRGSRWLSTEWSWAEGAREMQEGVGGGHYNDGVVGGGGGAVVARRLEAGERCQCVVGHDDIVHEIWAGAVRLHGPSRFIFWWTQVRRIRVALQPNPVLSVYFLKAVVVLLSQSPRCQISLPSHVLPFRDLRISKWRQCEDVVEVAFEEEEGAAVEPWEEAGAEGEGGEEAETEADLLPRG